MKILKIMFAGLVMGMLVTTQVALAAEFLAPMDKDDDPNVSTASSEVHKNLYAAGATVNINSQTNGDLYAAGGMVTVSGNVEQDLVVAGGNLNLNGTVGGDVRAAGGNISVSSPVGSDLVIAGGNVAITQKTTVAGDLVAAGGNLVIDSTVNGNAKISGGNVTINGKITGNLEVTAQEQLTFGPNSEVVGKITYKGRNPAVVKEGAKVGTIEFTELPGRKNWGKRIFAPIVLFEIIASFLAGWVFVYLFRRRVESTTERILRQPWQMLGLGLAGLVLTPVVMVILFATFVGYYIALVLMAWYFLMLLLSCLLAAIFTGAWILKLINKSPTLQLNWAAVLLGVVVMKILMFIPIVGWLAILVLTLLAIGSVLSHSYDQVLDSR